MLESLAPAAEAAGCPLQLIKVPKGGDPTDQCAEAIEFARASPDEFVGGLPKLKQSGPLCDAFAAALASSGVTLTDASFPLAILLVTHDQQAALQNSRKSGFLSSSVMNHAIKYVEDCIDKRKVWAVRLTTANKSAPPTTPQQLQSTMPTAFVSADSTPRQHPA